MHFWVKADVTQQITRSKAAGCSDGFSLHIWFDLNIPDDNGAGKLSLFYNKLLHAKYSIVSCIDNSRHSNKISVTSAKGHIQECRSRVKYDVNTLVLDTYCVLNDDEQSSTLELFFCTSKTNICSPQWNSSGIRSSVSYGSFISPLTQFWRYNNPVMTGLLSICNALHNHRSKVSHYHYGGMM